MCITCRGLYLYKVVIHKVFVHSEAQSFTHCAHNSFLPLVHPPGAELFGARRYAIPMCCPDAATLSLAVLTLVLHTSRFTLGSHLRPWDCRPVVFSKTGQMFQQPAPQLI